MARLLTDGFVRRVSKPGKHYDANGLFLRVEASGSKRWVQRLVVAGRRQDIGLGGWPMVTLEEAREAAFENRRYARQGGDPRTLRDGFGIPKFKDAIEAVIAIHEPTWKGGSKTAALWRSTLTAYAVPRLGDRRVSDISTADVMATLLPLWHAKPETARKVRQRIGAVMKWAIAKGHRQDNPAGEALSAALPSNGNGTRHFAAVPYADIPAAIETVRQSEAGATTKLALQFLILTAARSGEVRGARWDEIDVEAALWRVPAARTKTGKEFRVPLSTAALSVLRDAANYNDKSGLVFPSPNGKTLSDNTLSKLLRDKRISGTPHGFRSSFRDWCAEATNTPREIAEAALAHVVKSKVEAAYARTDHLEKRRALMERWAGYLAGGDGKVIRLRA